MVSAVHNKKEKMVLYTFYCFVVFIFGGACRCVKKLFRGKCSRQGQAFYSLLAFACLAGAVLTTAAAESEAVSFAGALFGGILLMMGFGFFAGMAGAFRPYHYMKKKARRSAKNQNVAVIPERSMRKSA